MQTLPFGPYQIINRGKWISTSKLDSTKSYLHNHTKRALHFHASLFIFQYIYVYVCDSSMLHVSIVVGYPRPKREKSKGGHSIIYSRIIIELWGKRFFFGCNYLEYIHIYIFFGDMGPARFKFFILPLFLYENLDLAFPILFPH